MYSQPLIFLTIFKHVKQLELFSNKKDTESDKPLLFMGDSSSRFRKSGSQLEDTGSNPVSLTS